MVLEDEYQIVKSNSLKFDCKNFSVIYNALNDENKIAAVVDIRLGACLEDTQDEYSEYSGQYTDSRPTLSMITTDDELGKFVTERTVSDFEVDFNINVLDSEYVTEQLLCR